MQAERPLGEHARRAARTYGAAADHYGLAALSFWDRFGAATVAGLPLAAGNTVLDLCCGAGASAIPAARLVGPEGRVLGIDVAESLLDMARARAAREGLANIEFRAGDATGTALPDGGFDAVICVFGVFFVPDMAGFVTEMWRLVRPGGALAITTWGAGLFEPANTVFWESVREVEPSLFKAFNPWDEITTEAALADLLARGGVEHPAVRAVPGLPARPSVITRHAGFPDFWNGHWRRSRVRFLADDGAADGGPDAFRIDISCPLAGYRRYSRGAARRLHGSPRLQQCQYDRGNDPGRSAQLHRRGPAR